MNSFVTKFQKCPYELGAFKILPMSLDHLPQVTALTAQLGYPGQLKDLSARFEILRKLPSHALFVFQDKDLVLGWIHLEAVDDLIEERKVEIKAIVVDETVRGRGIGHHLIEHAKKWSLENNLKTIYLSCNTKRTQTHQFYLSKGFTQTRSSHFFEIQV